jgi:hypothetical protein
MRADAITCASNTNPLDRDTRIPTEGIAAPRKFSLYAASIDQGEAAVAGGDPVRWRRLVVARYPPLPNAPRERKS